MALLACVPVAAVVLAAPLGQVVTTTYNDYLGNGNPEARTVLTRDSFAVAAAHFPGGAGFGRFGSAVAATNYSPEYVARGYPDIWGLGRTAEDGRFLTDTEWPAIIGETGFFGALAFALGLAGIYRAGVRLVAEGPLPADPLGGPDRIRMDRRRPRAVRGDRHLHRAAGLRSAVRDRRDPRGPVPDRRRRFRPVGHPTARSASQCAHACGRTVSARAAGNGRIVSSRTS